MAEEKHDQSPLLQDGDVTILAWIAGVVLLAVFVFVVGIYIHAIEQTANTAIKSPAVSTQSNLSSSNSSTTGSGTIRKAPRPAAPPNIPLDGLSGDR
jgi:hypothetical protein